MKDRGDRCQSRSRWQRERKRPPPLPVRLCRAKRPWPQRTPGAPASASVGPLQFCALGHPCLVSTSAPSIDSHPCHVSTPACRAGCPLPAPTASLASLPRSLRPAGLPRLAAQACIILLIRFLGFVRRRLDHPPSSASGYTTAAPHAPGQIRTGLSCVATHCGRLLS